MRRVILIDRSCNSSEDDDPWVRALDADGRLVMAAVNLDGEWSVYLAWADEPLGFDLQAQVGSYAPN